MMARVVGYFYHIPDICRDLRPSNWSFLAASLALPEAALAGPQLFHLDRTCVEDLAPTRLEDRLTEFSSRLLTDSRPA
jgi:hypothetical protein